MRVLIMALMSPGWVPLVVAAPSLSLLLGVGTSQTVKVASLERAAVANEKIAKVRAFPPDTLLITGVKPGQTTVRAWSAGGTETAYSVEVIATELYETAATGQDRGVIRVSLEFIEVDGAASESLGIRWPDGVQFSGSANVQGDALASGLNYSSTFTSARGLIQHLLRRGWAKVLARPDLYVRLGEEAQFHSGGEFPVALSVPSQGGYHRQVEWKPYGLTVKVRPQSGDRLHISSDIQIEVSELNPGSGMEGIPAISRRTLQTKMNSVDGETAILSGLVRQVQSTEKEGIPLLADIPLLGSLFSSNRDTQQSSEVFLAMTLSFRTRQSNATALERLRKTQEVQAP